MEARPGPLDDETASCHETAPGIQMAPDNETAVDDASIAVIERALYLLVRRLRQTLLKDHISQLAGNDIDQAGIAAMYVLYGEAGSLRVTDLAAQLGIDPPAVTRKVQQLERLGLVSRTRDADDARATRLQLTPEGHRVLKQFLLARHQWLTSLLGSWPSGDCQEFARLICRFAGDIDLHLEELSRPLPARDADQDTS